MGGVHCPKSAGIKITLAKPVQYIARKIISDKVLKSLLPINENLVSHMKYSFLCS